MVILTQLSTTWPWSVEQWWGVLENQLKFTSVYRITDTRDCRASVKKTFYRNENEALRAIIVLACKIRPKLVSKMTRIDLFRTSILQKTTTSLTWWRELARALKSMRQHFFFTW